MASNEEVIAAIRGYVTQAVAEHWTTTKRAMLLSSLGLNVRHNFPEAPTLMPSGLRSFLEAWPVVQVIGHPTVREKIGAIPLGEVPPSDPSELFSGRTSGVLSVRDNRQHGIYFPEFWRAFHRLITGRRFVTVPTSDNPTVRVIDKPDGEPEPGAIEIAVAVN